MFAINRYEQTQKKMVGHTEQFLIPHAHKNIPLNKRATGN